MLDAYSKQNKIRIGTSKIVKELQLTKEGRLLMSSLEHVETKKEYVQGDGNSTDEFFATINGEDVNGSSGGFTIENVEQKTLPQGEQETILSLKRNGMLIKRHYVAYPGLAVLQEWTEYVNNTENPITISNPSIFVQRLLQEDRNQLEFSYMTGGANFTGSQIFKTVPAKDGFVKSFDSNGKPEMMEVEGVFSSDVHPRFNGSGIWNEFFVWSLRDEHEGLFRTFDYQGWWKATMSQCDRSPKLLCHCELVEYVLPVGETLTIAPTTYGFYTGDKDDLGIAINEYIYQYKWDYTNDRYLNRSCISMWIPAPYREDVFKMVDIARYVGYDRVHVDDFWFDAKGNWNGILGDNWPEINKYIKQNGMFFRLWMPPWSADRLSKIWLEHPEWMLDFHGNWYNWTIDMSKEEAYQWILNMLCEKQKEFGTYELRVDGDPVNMQLHTGFSSVDKQGNWNSTLKQSANFYRLYREFKEKNPDAGLDGCSSGGHTLSIEACRYVEQQQVTDGKCMHMGGYDTTLILPIDKHQHMPIGSRNMFAGWDSHSDADMDLFSAPGSFLSGKEGEITEDILEAKRCDLEMFRFLSLQGMYGRYIKVYRPLTQHCDKTYLLQRMSWDCKKGLLMISPNDKNPLLGKNDYIYLKGLVPDEIYLIESRLGSMQTAEKTGAEWMREGVYLQNVPAGEYLFINLPDRPGTGSILEKPQAPTNTTSEVCHWLNHDGIGITWNAPQKNQMISYYELSKNGQYFTKVSIGTYYFDVRGGMQDVYRVRSVDFDGQVSSWVDVVR